jgi:predicted heme/steroid binding protein
MMAHGRNWILTTKVYQITYENLVYDLGKSFSYPGRIHLSARSRGYFLEGDFLCHRLVYTTDIFEKLPRLLRAIASATLKHPIMFRMVGHFEGNLFNPDGSVESLRLAGQGDYFTVR